MRYLITSILLLSFLGVSAFSGEGTEAEYTINPGDVLAIHVWGEESLSNEQVLVRPDGKISLQIVGQIDAYGIGASSLEEKISQKLSSLMRDKPSVTVSVVALSGNTVFVLGKVAKPGEYVMRRKTDVTQALALAGGLTTFAKRNDIKILRRSDTGEQKAIKFRYGSVEDGKRLDENIVLHSGDIIVVP